MHSPALRYDLAAQIEALEFAFADALAAQGYTDQLIPADGEWHDFAFPDSKRGKKNGAAKLTFGKDGVVIDRRVGNSPIFRWTAEPVELTDEQARRPGPAERRTCGGIAASARRRHTEVAESFRAI